MELQIRRANQQDALTLAQMRADSWRAAYKGIIADSFLAAMSPEADAPKYKLGPDDMPIYIAELDSKPVGFLVLNVASEEELTGSAQIQAMYLLPAYWSQGYGLKMMSFTIATLKEQGYPSVYLWVLEDNARARRFYELAGLKADGASQVYDIGGPLTLVRYVMQLSS